MKYTNSLTDTIYQNLHKEKIGNLNKSISFNRSESIVSNLDKESIMHRLFTGEFDQMLVGIMTPILYNLFQKIEAEEIFPKSF